ncbi:hypothetical protein B0H66DRAFT_305150 [Apodospora peruviana]|uniref:Uncharacterized protein n=1 Tax=Apodospora peruviana TaxID=516989 RepID=A0AAE0I1H1_9PEZI|nr:hypothetical protein B0H66DRAFT_305150 [Apodospora peruviana]
MTSVLSLTKIFKVSDPCDKIYGCLGLLPESVSEIIQPDYRKPITTVYTEAAQLILEKEPNYSLFSNFSFQKAGLLKRLLPSWVPDFASQRLLSYKNVRLWSSSKPTMMGFPRRISSIDNCLW